MNLRGLKVKAIAVVAVAGLCALGVSAASGRTEAAKSSVRITSVTAKTSTTVKFKGYVKSKDPVCEVGRTVELKNLDDNSVIGGTATNSKGKWRVSGYYLNPPAVGHDKILVKTPGTPGCQPDRKAYHYLALLN